MYTIAYFDTSLLGIYELNYRVQMVLFNENFCSNSLEQKWQG